MYKIMVLLYYYNIHQVLCKEFISVFFLIYRHVTVHMEINRDLVKQVRTPPVRPADGVVGCVYESFVPGGWHRCMEKEILWFCFRRAEPERMISGWTASSRDSSKTEEGKAPRGYGQIRSELRMSSKLKLSRILPL